MKRLIGAILFASLTTAAFADFVGPNNMPSSIKQLQDSAWDHQFVTLKGHITRQVANDLYEFNDGSGTILLDIDHKHGHNGYWPTDTPVNEKTIVEIYGKYERKIIGYTKIEVINLRVVK